MDPVGELTYTIYVAKKVSDGNYGGEEIGIHIQTSLPAGTDPLSPQAEAAMADAIHAAKCQIADGLNMKWVGGRYVPRTVTVADAKRGLMGLLGEDRRDTAAAVWQHAIGAGVIDGGDLTEQQRQDLVDFVKGEVEPFDTLRGAEDPEGLPPSPSGSPPLDTVQGES